MFPMVPKETLEIGTPPEKFSETLSNNSEIDRLGKARKGNAVKVRDTRDRAKKMRQCTKLRAADSRNTWTAQLRLLSLRQNQAKHLKGYLPHEKRCSTASIGGQPV